MKLYRRMVLAISITLVLTTSEAAEDALVSAPDHPTETGARPPAEPNFTPGFADLMTMLIQPRHIRLYLAGTARNWELAAFEMRELRSAFRRAGQAVPRYRNTDVDPTVTAIMGPHMDAIDAAIAAADAARFNRSFADLTAACNACHTYLEHPFLRIKVPAAASSGVYSNQEFKSAP